MAELILGFIAGCAWMRFKNSITTWVKKICGKVDAELTKE